MLLIDEDASGIRGIVRLCVEDGVHVLRSMQVREGVQRQGVGRALLQRFAELLGSRGVTDCWCMPYAHLEGFYGAGGFVRVTADEEKLAPPPLWQRYDKHRNRRPNDPVLLMRRKS